VRDQRLAASKPQPLVAGRRSGRFGLAQCAVRHFPARRSHVHRIGEGHRDGASPKLEAEIRAFVARKINHTREHIVFNTAGRSGGL
jgi:hypothetical protein